MLNSQTMKNIKLPFGRDFLQVDLPLGCVPHILRKEPMPILPNATRAVEQALNEPVACPALSELARHGTTVCIVICDITRPVPNGLVLPKLVQALLHSGVRLADISILVATGLHRPNVDDELLELIGDRWIFDNVRIENHDARDAVSMIDLGETPTDKILSCSTIALWKLNCELSSDW
jgi:lactate racemase